MNNNVAKILQNTVNSLYKEYLQTQDIEILDILSAIFPAITLKNVYFEEDLSSETPIILFADRVFEDNTSIENSYFLNLQNIINAIKINSNIKSKISKKKNRKIKSSKNAISLDNKDVPYIENIASNSDEDAVLNRFLTMGGKTAFAGRMVINITSTKTGIVTSCFMRNKNIYFKIKDEKANSEWSLKKCAIQDDSGEIIYLK